LLGTRATALDLATRAIELEGGRRIRFERLVIATGAQPRALPNATVNGVHTLRTLEDSCGLMARLGAGVRVAVVGGGFIGVEVAATAWELGCDVTLIESLPSPLSRTLGDTIGQLCAGLHREHGVDVRCNVTVRDVIRNGTVNAIRLDDDSLIPVDLVVVGIGVQPCTSWLETSGLELRDGVVCDSYCRTAAPGVVAAGDIARWRHPNLGLVRFEHWENAILQGEAAAAAVLSPGASVEYAPVPYVWSDQYDRRIQVVGHPAPRDEVVIADGEVERGQFLAFYVRTGRVTAAVAFNRARLIHAIRPLLSKPLLLNKALEALGREDESRPFIAQVTGDSP